MGGRKNDAKTGIKSKSGGGRKSELLPAWMGSRQSGREAIKEIREVLGPKQFRLWFGVSWTAKVVIPKAGTQERTEQGWAITIPLGETTSVTIDKMLAPPGSRDLEHQAGVALRNVASALRKADDLASATVDEPGLGRWLYLGQLQQTLRQVHEHIGKTLAKLAVQPDWVAEDRQWIVHVWDQPFPPAHRIDSKGRPKKHPSDRDLALVSLLSGNTPLVDASEPLKFLAAETENIKKARQRYRKWLKSLPETLRIKRR